MFYDPIYIRIFKPVFNRKLTLEDIPLVPRDQIEILNVITGPQMPHPIMKWLPMNFDNQQRMEVWADYFLDKCGDGSVGPKWFIDHEGFKGNKQLNKQLGWFLKTGHITNKYFQEMDGSDCQYDEYVKARRVIVKKDEFGDWVNVEEQEGITLDFDNAKDRSDKIRELKKDGFQVYRYPIRTIDVIWVDEDFTIGNKTFHRIPKAVKGYKLKYWKE